MSFLEIALIYSSGLFSGLILMAYIVYRIGSSAMKKARKSAESVPPQGEVEADDGLTVEQFAKISDRMTRIREITRLQLDLQSAVEGPQRNASDGKYKNSLMAQIKDLENEKADILKSIVTEGFDPKVNVMRADGTVEVLKLSDFLNQQPLSKDEAQKEKDLKRAKQIGKFTVHRGGRDDSGNPTTH